LPLKAYPTACVKAVANEFRDEIVRQLVDAPSYVCTPSLDLDR
jgi:hypothetical protein